MKHLALLIFIFMFSSCANSISEIEATYKQGVERVEQATTPQELTQITIDVRNELIEGAKGIGGDRILTNEESQRYINAQQAFERVVETKCFELTGEKGSWRSVN